MTTAQKRIVSTQKRWHILSILQNIHGTMFKSAKMFKRGVLPCDTNGCIH